MWRGKSGLTSTGPLGGAAGFSSLKLSAPRRLSHGVASSGFTLIELMIVVAVIGVLAAISVPNYAKARERAQKSACINNLRQIDWAKQQWALEHHQGGGFVPDKKDIAPYLGRKADIETIVCPAGGPTASFDTTYSINSITNVPTCLVVPDTHLLD